MDVKGPMDWKRISEEKQREKQEHEAKQREEERDLLARSLEVRDMLVSMGIKHYGLPWYHQTMKENELEERRIENFEDCFAEFHPYLKELASARDSGVFQLFWIDTDIGNKSCASVTEIAGRDMYGNKIIILQSRDGEVGVGE